MNTQHHATDDTAGPIGPDDRFITSDGGCRLDTRRPYITKGCDYQGRFPEAAEACTELGISVDEPPRPGLLYRMWRWAMGTLHDKAERHAICNRIVSIEHAEESIRAEIHEIRAVMFLGSPQAAKEAAARIKRRGEELDNNRAEKLRLMAKLAALDS